MRRNMLRRIYDEGAPIIIFSISFGEGSVAYISMENIAKANRENG